MVLIEESKFSFVKPELPGGIEPVTTHNILRTRLLQIVNESNTVVAVLAATYDGDGAQLVMKNLRDEYVDTHHIGLYASSSSESVEGGELQLFNLNPAINRFFLAVQN